MKKVIKWIGIAVLIPILLCLLLTVLIYLPPVQNWAVKKVAAIASEKTGMEISVGHVSLAFPLDLQLDDFKAIKQNDSLPQVRDTIADVHRLVADVRLLPLFRSRVVIDELSFHQARINTNGQRPAYQGRPAGAVAFIKRHRSRQGDRRGERCPIAAGSSRYRPQRYGSS